MSTRADVRRRTEPHNLPRIKPLSPKVTRCHQFRNTRPSGSTPAASTISRFARSAVGAASRLRPTTYGRRSRRDSRRLHHSTRAP
jgi:hypothetical protein